MPDQLESPLQTDIQLLVVAWILFSLQYKMCNILQLYNFVTLHNGNFAERFTLAGFTHSLLLLGTHYQSYSILGVRYYCTQSREHNTIYVRCGQHINRPMSNRCNLIKPICRPTTISRIWIGERQPTLQKLWNVFQLWYVIFPTKRFWSQVWSCVALFYHGMWHNLRLPKPQIMPNHGNLIS